MPIKIVVDPETGVAEGVGEGALSLAEMEDAGLHVWNHPDFGGLSVVWDLRAATVSLTSDQVREFAEFAKSKSKLRPSGRTAFVVSCNVQFGLVRMFKAFRRQPGIDLRIFRRIDDARRWARTGEGPPLPLQVTVDTETGKATAVGSGPLGYEDLQDGSLNIGYHPSFRHAQVFWDLRGASLNLSADEIRDFAEVAKSVCDPACPARVCFVVDNDLAYGLLRMFGAYRGQPGLDLRVFRDYDEGVRFVDGEIP